MEQHSIVKPTSSCEETTLFLPATFFQIRANIQYSNECRFKQAWTLCYMQNMCMYGNMCIYISYAVSSVHSPHWEKARLLLFWFKLFYIERRVAEYSDKRGELWQNISILKPI